MAVQYAGARARDALLCHSVSSYGHHDLGAVACESNGKAIGCEDRRLCIPCHVRIRTRHQPKIQYANVSILNTEGPLGQTQGEGAWTPDPPSVFNSKPNPDDSHESPLASDMTPRDERKTVGLFDLARELHSKLCALQGQENAGLSMTEAKTPEAYSMQEAWQGGRIPSARMVVVGTNMAAAITAPPGLPPPEALLAEEDVHALIPPPPPLPEQATRTERYPRVTSLGSVGHPWACAAACKYAGRKSGCRDGARCAKCHRCHWQRSRGASAEDPPEEGRFSAGTRGHPQACGPACKYARRRVGCRYGAACEGCHLCLWQREKTTAEAEPAYPKQSDAAAMFLTQGVAYVPTQGFEHTDDEHRTASTSCFSIGSFGHPLSCSGKGCKYNCKPKGCKDGRFCLRCHLCSRWR